MNSQKSGIKLLKKAYSLAYSFLREKPVILFPFLVFSIIEFFALIVVYLAPRMPLRVLLGPPISTFWGDKFLHYPLNFVLLPKLAALSRMGLSVVFGSLLTGMAVLIICDIYNKRTPKLNKLLLEALKKYASLFIIVFIFTFLFYFLSKLLTILLIKYFAAGHTKLLFLGIKFWLGPAFMAIDIFLAILIQSAFVYAIPILFIEEAKLIPAIIRSIRFFKKSFIQTIILVGLPVILYIPIVILNANTTFLIFRTFPEAVLLVSILGIIVASLVIDAVVTLSAVLFYLECKERA